MDPRVTRGRAPTRSSRAFVEGFYFLGEGLGDWAATWRLGPKETAENVLTGYRHAVRRSNEVIEGMRGSHRWALAHMIEETARHAGHADILREQIDGATGR